MLIIRNTFFMVWSNISCDILGRMVSNCKTGWMCYRLLTARSSTFCKRKKHTSTILFITTLNDLNFILHVMHWFYNCDYNYSNSPLFHNRQYFIWNLNQNRICCFMCNITNSLFYWLDGVNTDFTCHWTVGFKHPDFPSIST